MAAGNDSVVNPLAHVEANISRISSTGGPQEDDLLDNELVPRHFMASSPRRTSTNKHAVQQPSQAPAISSNEQAFLAEQGLADEGGIQVEDDQDFHDEDDQLDQDDADQSGNEVEELNSSLESMASILSSVTKRTEQASGDDDSDLEEVPTENLEQAGRSNSHHLDEEVAEKSYPGGNPQSILLLQTS